MPAASAGVANRHAPSSVRQAGKAGLQRDPADRIDHKVHSPPLGQAPRLGDEILFHIVDAHVEPELCESLELVVA
jgi:hypothetical protein